MIVSAPIVVLLIVGSLSFYSGCSSRMWRGDESRFRVIAITFGLICLGLGAAGLFGYTEVYVF